MSRHMALEKYVFPNLVNYTGSTGWRGGTPSNSHKRGLNLSLSRTRRKGPFQAPNSLSLNSQTFPPPGEAADGLKGQKGSTMQGKTNNGIFIKPQPPRGENSIRLCSDCRWHMFIDTTGELWCSRQGIPTAYRTFHCKIFELGKSVAERNKTLQSPSFGIIGEMTHV